MKAARFDYRCVRDLPEAIAALQAHADAKVLAGGQSLGPMLNLRLARPALLVDVSRVAALREVRDEGEVVHIGAGVTHSAIEDGCANAVGAGFLAAVASRIGYRAVRNRGTIGGSLAHADPAADWLTALTALDAELVVTGLAGTRRVPVATFMIGAFTTSLAADEVIEAVRVPKLSPRARWGYCKVARKSGEWADALGAVVIDNPRNHARVVMGATDGQPVILDELRNVLSEKTPSDRAAPIMPAVARAWPDSDLYQRQVHAAALRRAIEQACAP
jgi:carbon-monoxide dehydrogenase medium subunit